VYEVKELLGFFGSLAFRVRALVSGWCIYNGYVQFGIYPHNFFLFACVDGAFVCEDRMDGGV
jgi:hypothetical protein